MSFGRARRDGNLLSTRTGIVLRRGLVSDECSVHGSSDRHLIERLQEAARSSLWRPRDVATYGWHRLGASLGLRLTWLVGVARAMLVCYNNGRFKAEALTPSFRMVGAISRCGWAESARAT